MEEMEVSSMSIPASATLVMVAVLMPVVAWACRAMGRLTVSFSRLTSSKAV